jgi:23S rRNA (cytosine1962-C5)-methyltransferase
MTALYLKRGREKSILRRHPWVFSGAIDHIDGSPLPGETVTLCKEDGTFLGWAGYSPKSQISARVWSFDPHETISTDFFRNKINVSLAMRKRLVTTPNTNAYRLVHGESDGLPGLIVDRYAEYLVIQFLSAGADFWRDDIISILKESLAPASIYERSDVDVRRLEGLPERTGLLWGTQIPSRVQIQENGLKFWVDVQHGHKTGFYIDQRSNRQSLRQHAQDRSVLNCFSYTGGFAVYALAGGAASVLSIDSSADALALGRENITLNQLPEEKANWLEGDVFYALRSLRDQAKSFDLIVLDPPKFAATAAQAEKAARGYKDINLLAFKLLKPGGLLYTFSCSGGVTPDLFQKIVAGAALDAGVEAQIVQTLTQGPDHPVALNFPEGAYLKGLVCRVS